MSEAGMQDAPTRPVLIVLTEGYADWETPLISAAAGDFYNLQVRHATPGGGDITSMGGLRISNLPDVVPENDEIIVICGGDIWTTPDAPKIEQLLSTAHDNGHVIAGICAGVTPMARADLLAGAAHSTNGLDFMDRVVPGYAGRENHKATPGALADGRVITAPGTAPISFAAEVLRAAGVTSSQVDEMKKMLAAEILG